MEITVASKTYTLYFGFEFLDEINKRMGTTIDVEGQVINTRTAGLNFLQVGLDSYEPTAVVNALVAGTNTSPNKPARVNVESFVREMLIQDHEEYQLFVEELSEEIKKEPMLQAWSKIKK